MLSVRGIYTGKIIKPLSRIDKQPNTPVIITFLDEYDTSALERTKLEYRKLAESFDFGETPDEGYGEEMMSEYFSSFSAI